MALTVHYLGTSAVLPAPGRCNTSLAVDDGDALTLIDTADAPYRRLQEAGLAPERLARVIITHEHADHVWGLPSLLQTLWVAGRTEPLSIFALEPTWGLIDRLIEVFSARSWANLFPVERVVIQPGSRPFLESRALSMWGADASHSVPTAALRFESGGRAVAYSADTAPARSVVELAEGVDLLIHEATFLAEQQQIAADTRHSTAVEAARTAREASARGLHLVHFTPTRPQDLDTLAEQAHRDYSGPVHVPGDLEQVVLE